MAYNQMTNVIIHAEKNTTAYASCVLAHCEQRHDLSHVRRDTFER